MEARKVLETDPKNSAARQILKEIPPKQALYEKAREKKMKEEAAGEKLRTISSKINEARTRLGTGDLNGARESVQKALALDGRNTAARQLFKDIASAEKERAKKQRTDARAPQAAAIEERSPSESIWVSASKDMGIDRIRKAEQ